MAVSNQHMIKNDTYYNIAIQQMKEKVQITSACRFTGTFNPKMNYKSGDVAILDEGVCIFDGQGWENIDKVEVLHDTNLSKKTVHGTCRFCGAPLKNTTCEYCGVNN